MTCLHNHDQILEFLRKIFLKGFQIYQNYLCALTYLNMLLYYKNINNYLHFGENPIRFGPVVKKICEFLYVLTPFHPSLYTSA